MKLLLAAATEQEITPFINHLETYWEKGEKGAYHLNGNSLHICIHGVGLMATTYNLTKCFQKEQFNFTIQAGIGGSYNRDIQLGEVVVIESETVGDLGAEDHFQFLDIFEMKLASKDDVPFSDGKLKMPMSTFQHKIDLKKATGLTVNSATGSLFTANFRKEKYCCDVESMEGAAFHFVGLSEDIPFMQLRSISNYVEPRDKSKWKMKEAIDSLNKELIKLLDNF